MNNPKSPPNWQDITEGKATEEALREKEKRLRLAMKSASEGIWEWDFTTGLIKFDEVALRMLGYQPDYPPQSADWWFSKMHPEDRPAVEKAFFAFSSGESETYGTEFRLATKTGDYVWVASNAGIVSADEEGKPRLVVGIHRNITERKRAQAALEASEARYARLATNIPGVVFQNLQHSDDPTDDEFPYISPGVRELFGFTPEQVMGDNGFVWRSIHPDDIASLTDSVRRAVKTGAYWNHEFRINTAKGETKWIHGMASHERQANGSIFWDGLLLDISNRKEIESALRESESRFRGIFERAPIGMAIVDLNFGLKSCNQAYRDLLGRKESEIRNLQLKDFTHPDDLAENLRLQSRLGRGEIEEYSLEKRFIRKNGEIRWGHLTSCLLRDSNGSPLGFLGHVLDVTDQKQADERLRQMAKMEAVGRLAGGVAHDFNNMLGVILGRVDMLLEEIKPGQPFYDDLNEIRQAGARSADLTRQLLAFARKQTVSPRVIDINQTVNGMLKMLQRLIGENIEMEWIPGGNVWEVKIDPAQIDQLLVNLCVNARDAIAGLGKVVIETRNTVFDEDYCKDHEGFTPGEFAVIAVSDNGRGMDAETQSHLFEPFFTTKDQGKGTGLGLATVYGVVKQNNGFINVYSEPDHGTTFKIYLPRHNASSGTQPAKTPIKSWERGQGTILLVEDEPAILKMTSLMLERLGYVVVGTSTPRDAIRLATEHAGDIHLLITDVVMPEMNGRDLAKNILSLYPSLKCLFMSGYTASVIADHGVLNEGVNFIQKPFSKADLAAKVREVLAQK